MLGIGRAAGGRGQPDVDGDGIGDACDPTLSVVDAVQRLKDRMVSYGLAPGLTKALNAKLDVTIASWQRGNPTAAGNQLGAFTHQVGAQSGKGLTGAQADELSGTAATIADAIDRGVGV